MPKKWTVGLELANPVSNLQLLQVSGRQAQRGLHKAAELLELCWLQVAGVNGVQDSAEHACVRLHQER